MGELIGKQEKRIDAYDKVTGKGMYASDLDRLFSSDYIPATFFVDQSGNIVGEPIVGADPDGYLKRIESLLGQ